MKKKEQIDFSKEPELTLDGENIKFHYKREERLGMLPPKRENASFFNKKNRHIHILVLDVILILLIGAFFSTRMGKSRAYNENGLKYHLTKKYFTKGKTLSFNVQIKNSASEARILDDIDVEFKIFNRDNNREVHSQTILLSKQTFRPEEFILESIIIDKPPRGKYRAAVWIDDTGEKSVHLNFMIR